MPAIDNKYTVSRSFCANGTLRASFDDAVKAPGPLSGSSDLCTPMVGFTLRAR